MRTWKYSAYDDLLYNELVAIVGYMERCDVTELESYIRNSPEQSQGMRDFIADIIAGKLKRPKNKRGTNARRDFEIYLDVRDLMDVLITTEAAIAQVAPKFNLSEDAIESAYKRTKRKEFSGRG